MVGQLGTYLAQDLGGCRPGWYDGLRPRSVNPGPTTHSFHGWQVLGAEGANL